MALNNIVDNAFGLFTQLEKTGKPVKQRSAKKLVDEQIAEEVMTKSIQINTNKLRSLTQPNSVLSHSKTKDRFVKQKSKPIDNPISLTDKILHKTTSRQGSS